MKGRATKTVALAAAAVLCGGLAFTGSYSAGAASAAPLVYEAEMKLSGSEQITYSLPSAAAVSGNALAVKVFLKNTYNDALAVGLSAADGGTAYAWDRGAGTVDGLEYTASGGTEKTSLVRRENGYADVPYLYYGEILFPFDEVNGGAGAEVTQLDEVTIRILASRHNSFASGDSWTVDGISLYLFGVDCVTLEGGAVTSRQTVADFTSLTAQDVTHARIGSAEPAEGTVRKGTDEDLAVMNAYRKTYASPCATAGDMKIIESFQLSDDFSAIGAERRARELEQRMYLSGQKSDYSFVAGRTGSVGDTALYYDLDPSDFDAGLNSYAGVHFNFASKDAMNWAGAKGITVYVENMSDYLVSFALEFFQYNVETQRLEQYNLNDAGNKYKTVYAYNTETGEEFSYHTQTFTRVPASFKGWLRIPFAQYAAPSWSLAPAYGNTGVLDFDKNPVHKISITRLFNANSASALKIDDVALYYSDFGVGSLFNAEKPSIRGCIENGRVS